MPNASRNLICGAALFARGIIRDAAWSGASHMSGLREAAHLAAGPDEVRRSDSNHIIALEAL